MNNRGLTKVVDIGGVKIGGGNPIIVQSMTDTATTNVEATLKKIEDLVERGCEIVRVAVPDIEAAENLPSIVAESGVPIVADIHYSPDLALIAIEAGVAKLRLNPGNITSEKAIRKIARRASDRSIPIRIGVNSGSLSPEIIEKYGKSAKGMIESAKREIELLERENFKDIVVSLKSSRVNTTIEANLEFSEIYDYPLHLGITEAGPGRKGLVKSAIGIGTLLQKGVGDTIRVSLTDDPLKEVDAAYDILGSLEIRKRGVEIISCPTCGRSKMDVKDVSQELEKRLRSYEEPIKIAVMGCSVNGIGEASSSEIGVVGTPTGGALYIDGKQKKLICSTGTEEFVDELESQIKLQLEDRG